MFGLTTSDTQPAELDVSLERLMGWMVVRSVGTREAEHHGHNLTAVGPCEHDDAVFQPVRGPSAAKGLLMDAGPEKHAAFGQRMRTLDDDVAPLHPESTFGEMDAHSRTDVRQRTRERNGKTKVDGRERRHTAGGRHGSEAGGFVSDDPAPLPASTEPGFGVRSITMPTLSKVV